MTSYLFILVVIVAGRLVLFARAPSAKPVTWVLGIGVQAAVASAVIRGNSWAGSPATAVLLAMVPLAIIDRRKGRVVAGLVLLLLAVSWCTWKTTAATWTVRDWAVQAGEQWAAALPFRDLPQAPLPQVVLARTLCLMLCLREAGLLVETLLALFGIAPADTDQKDFVRSKFIGVIERMLLFMFGVFQAFSAAAFVLTAKSMIRFYENQNRQSAEYVLIGTLFSTLIALSMGLLSNWLSGTS